MARVDSILNLVDRQGANELRLGTDREPQMFASGEQKRLVIPKTSTETLRELLGELFPQDREQQLLRDGRVEFTYEAAQLGPFRVTLTKRGGGGVLALDAVFLRGRGKGAAEAPPAQPSSIARRPHAPPAHRDGAADAGHEPAPAHVELAPRHEQAVDASRAHVGAERPTAAAPQLAEILTQAARLRASDVHLMSGDTPVIRIDGKLRALTNEPPVDLEALLGAALDAHARRRLAEGSSADIGLSVDGVGRCRVNVYATSLGLAAAVRLVREHAPTLAELDLPAPLEDLVELPHGLVLVVGPTGSGKSSTLAGLAQEALLRRSIMLVTLEDPIEFVLASKGPKGIVRQRQVGRDVKDFATGLRDALREDPDILLIGEMRDAETIALALTAAETGHLVLASLHSRSAASAVERMVDAYPPARQAQIRVQIAESLRAVVAQRLLPRVKGDGRVAALEILRVNPAVASAIREAKTSVVTSAMQSGKKEGMLPLERCLADLVQRRVVGYEDARAVANDLPALGSYLSG
ncbi:MAG TPA: PilT/PilU family type 4a pilus ATPase [Byssovorax sp.]|jgi:twitching motility protein PilT